AALDEQIPYGRSDRATGPLAAWQHAGDLEVRIPGGRMPDAAEAAVAGGDLGLQYGTRVVTQQQIDVADNAGADRGRPVAAARAHRGDAVGELDFAHGAERFRSVCAIHRAAIDVD